jgi:hypothetical protein
LLKPSAGKVWIDGKDTATAKTVQLAGQVALLFQNPDDQICKRTVWDEVVFGPRNLGYPTKRIESLAEEALTLFDLTPFKTQNPYDFGYSDVKELRWPPLWQWIPPFWFSMNLLQDWIRMKFRFRSPRSKNCSLKTKLSLSSRTTWILSQKIFPG